MKRVLWLTLVLMACAKEKPNAPPTPAAKYAGTWEGRSFRSPTDTGIAWSMTMKLDTAGRVSGTMTLTGSTQPPIPIRILELTDSTVLEDIGPYMSPTLNTEVVARTTGHIAGDSLWGTLTALPTQGGKITPGLSAAEWGNYEMHPTKGAEPIHATFGAKRKSSS